MIGGSIVALIDIHERVTCSNLISRFGVLGVKINVLDQTPILR